MLGFVIFFTDLVIAEVESLIATASEHSEGVSTAPSSGSRETSQCTDKELGDRNVEQSSWAEHKLPQLFSRYDSHTQKKKNWCR